MTKKSYFQTLEDKYEKALMDAGRWDVFRIVEKINKKRKRRLSRLIDSLGFEQTDVDEFEISEWNPRIPSQKRGKKK